MKEGEKEVELLSLESTHSDDGDEVYFITGYGALEIAKQRAKETSGQIYVNNVSSKIKRPDMTRPVNYAVSKSPVYTLHPPDQDHDAVYRCYWRPLE